MRIKDGFELREICGENVILSHGMNNIDFSKLISLNETAAYMWKSVEDKDFDIKMLTDVLCDAYEVDRETAERDVNRVVSLWKENGLIE